jgi:hypothetical protein
MRKLVGLYCLVLAVLLVAGAAAETEIGADFVESVQDPPLPASEPITGVPLPATPGTGTPQRDPFTPYDIGDPASAIPYEVLGPEDRAVIDRGRNADGWRRVHDAYGAATAERATLARAEAAAHQLGVSDLATEGVIP